MAINIKVVNLIKSLSLFIGKVSIINENDLLILLGFIKASKKSNAEPIDINSNNPLRIFITFNYSH